ncbi:MAG: hypothetical protein WCL61_03120 [bacterium]
MMDDGWFFEHDYQANGHCGDFGGRRHYYSDGCNCGTCLCARHNAKCYAEKMAARKQNLMGIFLGLLFCNAVAWSVIIFLYGHEILDFLKT